MQVAQNGRLSLEVLDLVGVLDSVANYYFHGNIDAQDVLGGQLDPGEGAFAQLDVGDCKVADGGQAAFFHDGADNANT
jgi:hypothetical protein